MAPKTITVSGEEQGYLIGDNEEFKAMLDVYGVRFLVNQDGKRVLGFASLVDGGKYTLGPPQQQKHENQWYCVKGTIQRPKSSAGDRFKLVQLARGGYYPHNGNLEDAFQCLPHPDKVELRLISVSVVFLDENAANHFIADVHSYVTKSPGVVLYQGQDFLCSEIDPFNPKHLVLETHYEPREADGEAPKDSPVWDVEISLMDVSAVTSYYSYEDTVYKYQRIEETSAFARSIPEGAHIFPKAKCHGVYEWLDKQEFNRLALSGPGHQQFDGTGRGRGKKAKTNPMVSIEPTGIDTLDRDGTSFTRIAVRLWCRNANVATAWRPFLPNHTTLHNDGNLCYYDGLYIYCETQRRQAILFEQQQNPNGGVHQVCLTAIPGIDDPSSLTTWDGMTHTVAVYEIMQCLLRWNHLNTGQTWTMER